MFCGQTRPGSIHDLTQVRQAGLVELLALVPGVTLLAAAGYQGLSAQTGGAVLTPRPARWKNQIPVFPAVAAAHEAERRAHAAQRIRVEHGISHPQVLAGAGSSPRPTRAPGHYAARSPGWSPARNEPPDPTSSTAHRRLYRPARSGDRTRSE
jgi:hypothetical protein